MSRKFVNMIVRDLDTSLYSLCRIDHSKHLFHKTREAAQKAAAAAAAKKKNQGLSSTMSSCRTLPKAAVNFRVPAKNANAASMHFFSLLRGLGEGCVLFANPLCHATVYDVASHSVTAVPEPNYRKPVDSSMSLCMTKPGDDSVLELEEHRLYVLGTMDGLFEVFNYSRTGDAEDQPPCEVNWEWVRLPLPPPLQLDSRLHWTEKCSKLRLPSASAVVDGATIWVSLAGGGTYAFDTETRQWSEAGSWVLPIRGAAEYAPELGLWFGLRNSSGYPLSAFDLKSGSPVEQHSWDYLGHVPDDWWPSYQRLLYLGSGKFCIASLFSVKQQQQHTTYKSPWTDDESDMIDREELTVLTGLEVVRDNNGLQMIKHKSKLFRFPNIITLHCVL